MILTFLAAVLTVEVNRSPRIYMIFSRPRSGTNMLEDFLDSNQLQQLDHGHNEIMIHYTQGRGLNDETAAARSMQLLLQQETKLILICGSGSRIARN
jgi:hypothetical protein